MKLIKNWIFNYNESILNIKLSASPYTQPKSLFASTKSGKIIILDLNGKLLFEVEITENSPIWNLEICELNNDGEGELVLGGMDGFLRVFKISTEPALEPLWAHQFGSSISGFKNGKISNDKNHEIIAYSLDGTLRLLSSKDGSLIWGQVFEEGIEDAKIWTDKIINKKEILACGNDGTIRIFEAMKGNLLWFKRFPDKVRLIDYINTSKGSIIICGGDDKQLHLIDKNSQEEIKTIGFDNYLWKCLSFPPIVHHSILVSSYSFDYLENSKPIQEISFNSKLICINQNLELVWELKNKNVEVIHRFQMGTENLIAIGTTQGELLILDEKKGTIKYSNAYNSSINAIQYELENRLLIIGYEDGLIKSYHIKDN